MASVPNTNIFPATPKAGAPAPAEGEGGEFFASLLPPAEGTIVTGPALPAVLTAQLPAAQLLPANGKGVEGETDETSEGADGEADGDDAIAALFAQADFVPVVQPQAAVAAAATVVTTAVPIAPDAKAAETHAVAPEGKSAPIQLPLPTAVTAPIQLPLPTAVTAPTPAAASPFVPVPAGPNAPAPVPQAAPAADAAKTPDAPALEAVVKLATKLVGDGKSKGDMTVKTARAAATDRARNATAQAPEAAPAARIMAPVPAQAPAAETAPVDKAPAPAAAIVQPVAPPPTATAPIVAPAELLATTTAAPAERAATSQPQPTDASIEHELDLAHEGEWLDRLARDIAGAGASDGPMRFKLNPQTLGHMRVELTQTDQGTNIRLTVETEAARAIIADAQPRLAAEARAQGVRIGQTEIDLAGNGHQAAGEQRRQEEARQTSFIRTARGAEAEVVASVETARTHRSDRYA